MLSSSKTAAVAEFTLISSAAGAIFYGFYILVFFWVFKSSLEQSLLAPVPPASLYVTKAHWLWIPVKFEDGLKTLSLGGWQDGWAGVLSLNLSEPAAVQGYSWQTDTAITLRYGNRASWERNIRGLEKITYSGGVLYL